MTGKARICLSLVAAVICICFLSSCSVSNIQSVPAAKQPSAVSADSELQSQLDKLIEDFFHALSTHDHVALMLCTDDSFLWNYNETEFENYCRDITECSDISADYSSLCVLDGEYELQVSYTLSLAADPDNPDGAYSNVSKTEIFYIVSSDGKYLISSVSDVVVG